MQMCVCVFIVIYQDQSLQTVYRFCAVTLSTTFIKSYLRAMCSCRKLPVTPYKIVFSASCNFAVKTCKTTSVLVVIASCNIN